MRVGESGKTLADTCELIWTLEPGNAKQLKSVTGALTLQKTSGHN